MNETIASRLKNNLLPRRLAAYLLDWFLSDLCISLPIVLIYGALYDTTDMVYDLFAFSYPVNIGVGMLCLCTALLYFLIIPAFLWKGQTPGKKLCHLKIVTQNNAIPSISTLCLRQVCGILLLEGALYPASLYVREIIVIITNNSEILRYLYMAGLLLSILSILLTLFTVKQQSLHDLLAHTKVIKA